MMNDLIELQMLQPDKKLQEIEIPSDGISLDLLRAVYRNPSLPLTVRIRCAVAALPHEVPRLMVSAQVSESDFATLLDRRIKRFEEMKLLEAKSTNGEPSNGLSENPCSGQVQAKPTNGAAPRAAAVRWFRRI